MGSSCHARSNCSRKAWRTCGLPRKNCRAPRRGSNDSSSASTERSTSTQRVSSTAAVAWAADRAAIDRALADVCERFAGSLGEFIGEAVRYSLLGGGKRRRGLLFLAAYRSGGGGQSSDACLLAAAIEVVHAYSLVHDDLPCMDNDDVRRGRPTLHRAFGVRVATVAGVAMVPLAAVVALD